MKTYVGLLRGVNVGGNNILPMQALREIFEALGCAHVQTYIQSGNVVFAFDEHLQDLCEQIIAAIDDRFGFRPKLLLIERVQFAAVVTASPFANIEQDPKSLHVWFLAEPAANPDIISVDNKLAESESYALEGNAFYLHAPDGIGRSKLAGNVEKYLDVDATARNWRTVIELNELAKLSESNL